MTGPARIRVIDSHTAGEPTRVVLDGMPDLGSGTVAERAKVLARDHAAFLRAVCTEPRGSDVLVGALFVPASIPDAIGGVIFFNNVGVLGMCGHGTMGLAVTLARLNRIATGEHTLETPVGQVRFTLHNAHRVSVRNVVSCRYREHVAVQLDGGEIIHGDIAWGGNWFFLVHDHGQTLIADNVDHLARFSQAIRQAVERQGITGPDKAIIDHIELCGPSRIARGKNFVLCPGLAYDRSPCGTGTSAHIASLAADGKLAPGEVWTQESIIGSVFEATFEPTTGGIIPTITGEAFVTAEATLIRDAGDPFRDGLRCRSSR
jgi:4-hydroxyproline epimerase